MAFTTMLAELLERCLDAQFDADFDAAGLFRRRVVKGRDYWYYHPPAASGEVKDKYVGPADDEQVDKRVKLFRRIKDDYQARRSLVSTLVREARLFRPDHRIGATVEALWKAGVFRLRACLVGTVAYQCYGAVLGCRLGTVALQTGDIDLAQFHSISVAVEDSAAPLLEALRSVDPGFRAAPQLDDQAPISRFVAPSGLRVDILTPNTRSDEHADQPVAMPALGGAGAQPLRFLDYLIKEPVRTVMLHGGGIPVLVPQPARFAVHKLIVAARRPAGEGKGEKDLRQAEELAGAMAETGRSAELREAALEAMSRGQHWREAIGRSMTRMASLNLPRMAEIVG